MNKFIKPLIYTFSSMLVFIFVLTILNYINILNGFTFLIFKIISLILSLSLGGYTLGKNVVCNGWKNGLELGSIIAIIFFIINIILKTKISIKLLIGYVLIMIVTTLSSMFGISKKA